MGQRPEAMEALHEAGAPLYRDSLCARVLAEVTLELAQLYLDSGRKGGPPGPRWSHRPRPGGKARRIPIWFAVVRRCSNALTLKRRSIRVFRRVDGCDMSSRSFLLGGHREFLTVLMGDIVSFTAPTLRTLSCTRSTQTLNDYFTFLMTNMCGVRHHGHVIGSR